MSPTYVEYGAADAGIAGLDVLMESRADVVQPLGSEFGYCKIAVAAPKGVLRSMAPIIRPFALQRNIRTSRWIFSMPAAYRWKLFR